MSPLLTIGLPVYNSMPYLREAFESLSAQTETDFKILAVVQDCSDGSLEYLSSVRDPRLRIIQQSKPSLTSALNTMLREIDTPWLVRMDTDDISYSTRLERVVEHIHRFPCAGMFYSLADYYPDSECLGQFRCSRGSPDQLRRLVVSGRLLSFCHPSVILNREKTLSVGGYRENVYIEDADLWWRMALAYEIRLIPEALVGYRQNSSSLTSHNLVRQQIEVLYVQYCLLSHLWELQPEPFERVKDKLKLLVGMADVRAKEHLRNVNMQLSERNYQSAAAELWRCWQASPTFLLKRALDELRLTGMICNGVSPRLYLQRKGEFWPSSLVRESDQDAASRLSPQFD